MLLNRKNRLASDVCRPPLEQRVMLDAATTEQPDLEPELNSPLVTQGSELPSDSLAADAIDFSALTIEELGELAAEGADIIGRNGNRPNSAEELDEELERGQSLIAGVRGQLQSDGATVSQLEEFDQAVSIVSSQRALSVAGSPDFDQAALLSNRNSLQSGALAGFSGTRARVLEPVLNQAIEGAFTNDGDRQVTKGRLQLGTYLNFQRTLVGTAADLARGVVEGDANSIQDAQDEFGSIRAELVRRGSTTEAELEELNESFGSLSRLSADALIGDDENGTGDLSVDQPDSDQPLSDAISRMEAALRETALSNNDFEDGFRIKDTRSFVGDNGKDSITIYSRDAFAGEPLFSPGSDTPFFLFNVLEHQVYIEDIIERQLQEAGQSYELVNIEVNAEASTDRSLSAIAEAAPDYATISLTRAFRPEFYETGIRSLAAAGNSVVDGVDLSVPFINDTIGNYADVIRTVALNADRFADDLPERDVRLWGLLGEGIEGLEALVAAGTNVFTAIPNNNQGIPESAFVQTEGLPGTFTRVGAIATERIENVFETNEFVTLEDGATAADLVEQRLIEETDSASRSPYIDVFAHGGLPVDPFDPDGLPFGLDRRLNTGNSFGTPDMAVNAILGRFDPVTKQRIEQNESN